MGYGGGVIGRYSDVPQDFPEVAEFHTMRINQPAAWFYTSDALRKITDIWERHGSGLTNMHGSTGDIVLLGCKTEALEPTFAELTSLGFDLGGSGSDMRTPSCCVGQARCEWACYDTMGACYDFTQTYQDELHRPAFPYKYKLKFAGCPNDCVNAIQRSDMATIGTWRDNIRVNEALVQDYYKVHGMHDLYNDVVGRCPTRAIAVVASGMVAAGPHTSVADLGDGNTLCIDNKNCVRCMHCLNVIPGGLLPGNDKGVSILVGGKGVLKIGATMGTMVIPFMKLESDDDFEKLNELARNILDFFAENALEHERTGEMIERIGLTNFLEGLDIPVDPNMIKEPRSNPYFRSDDWDEQVEKWNEYKQNAA